MLQSDSNPLCYFRGWITNTGVGLFRRPEYVEPLTGRHVSYVEGCSLNFLVAYIRLVHLCYGPSFFGYPLSNTPGANCVRTSTCDRNFLSAACGMPHLYNEHWNLLKFL